MWRIGLAGLCAASLTVAAAGQQAAPDGHIGGVASSSAGPEAGVVYPGNHIEDGKGTLSKMVKFQIRPDPLAR